MQKINKPVYRACVCQTSSSMMIDGTNIAWSIDLGGASVLADWSCTQTKYTRRANAYSSIPHHTAWFSNILLSHEPYTKRVQRGGWVGACVHTLRRTSHAKFKESRNTTFRRTEWSDGNVREHHCPSKEKSKVFRSGKGWIKSVGCLA